MKTIKQVRREARHLFRLCFVDGSLDDDRVRRVVKSILSAKRRGYLALANQFERLVKFEQSRYRAEVESAAPLPPGLRANIRESLARIYGPGISISFSESPTLIGGMRIKVRSNVYDGSIKSGLAALERRFSSHAPKR
jgi:F-type H+-transporting ATPase subunit delta